MKIRWMSEVPGVTREQTLGNIAYAKSLGLPCVSSHARPPLAVIGGGPSAADFATELRGWAGDVWVSGSAFPWALSIGLVRPTFFTIDQSPQLAIDGKGATKAILATCCNKATFDELKSAKVEIFDLVGAGPDANHWATTVTAAPHLAMRMGYKDVTFYGCDSSFRGGVIDFLRRTHAYPTDQVGDAIIVECGGKSFITRPSFVMQAEFMSQVLRLLPNVFKVRGDGLLSEMVRNPEYETTHATHSIASQLMPQAA